MPEALSFAPGPAPELSRCAMTAITSFERPWRKASTFSSCDLPAAGDFRVKTVEFGPEPVLGRAGAATHEAASRRHLRPRGLRSGNWLAKSRADLRRGGAVEIGRQRPVPAAPAAARPKKPRSSRGMPTRSQVPRYMRLLTGRSTEPGRARRR